jgi:hypothetical protein
MVTRSEGYQRSGGYTGAKQEEGKRLVEDFYWEVLGYRGRRVTDPEEDRLRGDIRYGFGYVEVKRIPLDPYYPHTFVEICEVPKEVDRKPYHRGGFARTAWILGMKEDTLANQPVKRYGVQLGTFGRPTHLSCSIEWGVGSDVIAFAGPDRNKDPWIYCYPRRTLLAHVYTVLWEKGFVTNEGNMNDVTFGVRVPNADYRWKRHPSGVWTWHGLPPD